MAADPSVVINLAAEYTGKKAFSKAETATKSLTKSVKGLAGAFGIAFGVRGAMSAVKAFAADDKAAKVLSKTLDNLGLAFADPAVKKFIGDLERQYGVVDDKLRPAYQSLLTATGNYVKSQDLLKTALDLSAMSGADVVSVSADLARAYQGNTRGLMKYNLGLTKTELQAMSFEEILAQVAKVSQGQAQVAADSYAGSLDKLSVASSNASESIGKDLINALTTLGGTGGLPKTLSLVESIASAIGDAIIGFSRLIRVIDIITGSGSPIEMIKRLNAFTKEYKAADAAERLAAAGGGGFSSYNAKKAADALALANAKKITKETKSTAAAALAAANAKKLSLAIDKANLALAKGSDVFDMDKIQLNAALIGQAEALGKATTGSQILAIANDVQRLKVKQDISALEDAIASKDTAAIEKATAKLNEDMKILGALQKQDAKLLDINNVLAGMKSTDLINLANLQAALDLLAQFKFPTLTLPGIVMPGGTSNLNPNAGITFNPNQNKDRNYDNNILDIASGMASSQNIAGVDFNPTQNKDRNYTNNVININAGVVGSENIIVDAVQNALNEIARRGNLTTYAGAISA
jgi:hypothetical protein